jgi:predicted Fe-Mo cluster-binding NifX family protein
MKKNFRVFYLIVFISVVFIQVQQFLAADDKPDKQDINSTDKIAVAAVSDSETSKISNKAGRAPYFLIFDCSGRLVKAIKNPVRKQRGGASASVTALLKKESVKIFIAVKFGTKMESNLKVAGIEYRQHSGIAKKVVDIIIKSKRSKDEQK